MSENRNPIVPIKLVVEAIEMAAEEWRQFLDIEKMEIVSIPDSSFGLEISNDDIKNMIIGLWKSMCKSIRKDK